MAMYVLLSFEDDEDALTLIDDMLSHADSMLLTPVQENGVKAVVEGLYKRPTMFCDPMDTIHGSRRVHGWTKGQKWGWWVCGVCKKPSRVAARNFADEVCGYNLIERFFPKEVSDADS